MRAHLDKVKTLEAAVEDLNNEKKSLKRSLTCTEAKAHVKNNTNETEVLNKKLKADNKLLEKNVANLVTSRSNLNVRFDDASRELGRFAAQVVELQVESREGSAC